MTGFLEWQIDKFISSEVKQKMKKHLIRSLVGASVLVLLSTGLAGAKESKEWQSLFDGNSLSGWVQRGGKAKYHVEYGVIVGTTVPNTRKNFI